MRPSIGCAFAVVTPSRADGLRAEALIAQNEAVGAAVEAPQLHPPIPVQPRINKPAAALATVPFLLSLFVFIMASRIPENAVDVTQKLILAYTIGTVFAATSLLTLALVYHGYRRAMREYRDEMQQVVPQQQLAGGAVAIEIDGLPRGLSEHPPSEHLPKSLTDPHKIGQLFSGDGFSLLASPVEAIVEAIAPEASAEQFIAAINHIFADTPSIDAMRAIFSSDEKLRDAKLRVGELLNNKLNYKPTDRNPESMAENETRDDVAIQFLTLVYAASYLHKNPSLQPGIDRGVLLKSCQDFYTETLVPHCKKNYPEEAAVLDDAWPLFLGVATGSDVNVEEFSRLNANRLRTFLNAGGAEERKEGEDRGGGGGGGGGAPSRDVLLSQVSAAAVAAEKEL